MTKAIEVALVDGTIHAVEFADTHFVCGVCGEEYAEIPFYGYCDERQACAFDEGQHFISL